jgi:hypothetical protein
MKRTVVFMMMLVLCTALVSTKEIVSQKPLFVGKSCVGECGKTAKIEYKVKATINKMMIARTYDISFVQ